MLGKIVLTVLAISLAGCAATQAELAVADHDECLTLGFTEGTEGYGHCRLELRSIRAQEKQARAAFLVR